MNLFHILLERKVPKFFNFKFPRNFYFIYNYHCQAIQYINRFYSLWSISSLSLWLTDTNRRSNKFYFCTSKWSYTPLFVRHHLQKFTLQFVGNIYSKQTNPTVPVTIEKQDKSANQFSESEEYVNFSSIMFDYWQIKILGVWSWLKIF